MTPKDFIDRFALDTIEATRLLYEKKLFGHLMILIYSAIDAMGLLDAPPKQTSANGKSFQAWVKKYLLNNPEIQFNEIDLWAARCSVLHTFTSKSDLSNAGKARQIQYYSGPKDSPMAKAFVEAANDIDGGAHVPGHIEDTYMTFLDGLGKFAGDLVIKCSTSVEHEKRLRNVLQPFSL
ncbi:hypothetical protein NGA35_14090 [Pseudomonas stutzeri]|nr:hypothetical protein [Stutzerimonas stutzeri]